MLMAEENAQRPGRRARGVRHTAAADVNLIRQLLADRYRLGFAIVKELLQNADDAGATTVWIGRSDGLPQASHPLLRGPAVFAINDGPVKPSDLDAICAFGLTNKAEDTNKVGRFGLGLKSIFNLCEVFFYVASKDPKEQPGGAPYSPWGELMNPWIEPGAGDPLHPEWDEVTDEDVAAIAAACQRTMDGANPDQWLCFWLPVRDPARTGCTRAVVPEFPLQSGALDRVLGSDTGSRVALTLPLLANLRRVVQVMPFGVQSVTLTGSQRLPFSETPQARQRPLMGAVEIRGAVNTGDSPNAQRVDYVGLEDERRDADLIALTRHERWPRSNTYDALGKTKDCPAKAHAHGAAVLLWQRTNGDGWLRISKGVFLPLGDKPWQEFPIKDWRADLILHGYLFSDSSRDDADVEPPPSGSPQDPRKEWNATLFQRATLPAVLPALQQLITRGVDEELIWEVTTALRSWLESSPRYRSAVCTHSSWVPRLRADGSRSWEAPPSRTSLLVLPAGAAELLPQAVLPGLAKICSGCVVTIRDWPRLTPSQETSAWSDRQLEECLDGASGQLEALAVVVSLFEAEGIARRIDSAVTTSLASAWLSFVRSTLRSCVGQPMGEQQRELLARLVRLVPASRRISLACEVRERHAVPAVLSGLLAEERVSRVVVPRSLSEQEDLSPITVDDALPLLEALAAAPGGALDTSELASQIVSRSPTELRDRARELQVFACRDPGARGWRLTSLSELGAEVHSGLVFLAAAGADPLLGHLTNALATDRPVAVGHDLARWFEAKVPDHATIRRYLAQRTPELAPLPQRVELLRALTAGVAVGSLDDTQRRGLRYLLHGRSEDDARTPLLAGTTTPGDVWSVLAEYALAQLGEPWRWLPGDALGVLPPEAQPVLNIRPVEARSVADLLERVAPPLLSLEGLSPLDCERIVRDWPGDPAVLGRLPIHELADGSGRTAVGPDVRLEGSFDPFEGPLPHPPVRLLRRSPDAVVALRQETFVAPLDASEALRFLCTLPEPHQYWQTFVRAIHALAHGRRQDRLPPEVREVSWVPFGGRGVRHRDLVHLEGVDHILAQVLPPPSPGEPGPIPIGHLETEVQEKLLPDGVRAYLGLHKPDLEALGRALSRLPGWRIGERSALGLSEQETPIELLKEWLGVFSRARELVPAYQLLAPLSDSDPQRAARLISLLAGRIDDVDRLSAMLGALRTEHARTGRDRRPVVLAWFTRYVRAARQEGELQVLLELDLELPAADGTWRTPAELCHPSMGDQHHDIDPSHLLADELAVEIPPPPATGSGVDGRTTPEEPGEILERDIEAAPARLRELLNHWQGQVPDECLGAFVALLGDDPGMRQLAESFLGDRSIEGVRARLNWKVIPDSRAHGMDEPVDVTMAKQRFALEVRQVDHEVVPNLRGQPRSFPIRREVRTWFVSRLKRFQGEAGRRVHRLVLRPIGPEQFPDEDKRLTFLQANAQELMSWIYNRPDCNLEAVFSHLRQTDQINLEVAQELILQSAHDTFRLSGKARPDVPELRKLLRELDAEIAREAEARGVRDEKIRNRALSQIEKHKQALRQQLADPRGPWSLALLATARERIQDYQYRPTAIPFELLQNADDAGMELRSMRLQVGLPEAEPGSGARRFVVVAAPTRLAFLHWGRPVNLWRLQGWEEGRELCYDRDLKKMLSFAASDKTLGEVPRHGRFGLGFKSTLLVSSTPQVLSARTHFAVSGGRFPIPLPSPDLRRLREDLEARGTPSCSLPGTIVELPLDQPDAGETALREFRSLTPVLVLFTQWIDSIELIDETGPETRPTICSRQGTALPGLPDLERTTVGLDGVQHELLVFRCEHGVVVLRVGAEGFERLPAEVPTFWAMAPTDQCLRAGFLLNAKFELDPGRTQLASNSAGNRELLARLGQALGRALVRLHDGTQRDWPVWRRALGMPPTGTADDLWESLWKLLSGAGEGGSLLEAFVWGTGAALRGALPTLIQGRALLPTELEGHGRFTVTSAIQAVAGELLVRPQVSQLVGGWSTFRDVYPLGSVIARGVWDLIPPTGRDALGVPQRLPRLTVSDLIALEIGTDECCTPEAARRLAGLVGAQGLIRWHEGSREDPWQQSLARVRFQGADRRWTTADRLLASAVEPDLVGFAPPMRRLHAGYDAMAQTFFQVCRRDSRGSSRPDAQEVAAWFRAAADDAARTAALRFLAVGEAALRNGVIELLRFIPGSHEGWWHGEAERLLGDVQVEVAPIARAMLMAAGSPAAPPPPPYQPPPPDSRHCLERIADWWDDHHEEEIARYERELYRGRLPVIDTAGDLTQRELRREWIRLLLLGGLHRLGRTRPSTHGTYLQLCERKGWLEIFATPHPNRDAWARMIEEYLDQPSGDLPYYQWVSQFVTAYQLSRWLEHYAQGFLLLDQVDLPSLQAVLSQRHFPGLQFTGLDAPSAVRALSLGANFVSRELVRLGVVADNPVRHPFCFLPRRAVRQLVASIGGPVTERRDASYEVISRRIHEFVAEHLGPERATFRRCFDLPLGIVAEREDLRDCLLGSSTLSSSGPEETLDDFNEDES